MTDVVKFNKQVWNRRVEEGNRWTVAVGGDEIEKARNGEWQLVLTPVKPVPLLWYGADLSGRRVLCLASGGGQQGPVLAAAGAKVTVLDNSPRQLEKDMGVSDEHSLGIRAVEGDMADLSMFADGEFDLIFHPVSNCFCENIAPVWKECHRVLKPGGRLLSGFTNPLMYIFDAKLEEEGTLKVRHKLPYSDLSSISAEERKSIYGGDEAIEFGHTLEQQIGGQIAAGFAICGFYEDSFGGESALDKFTSCFMATLAVKQ